MTEHLRQLEVYRAKYEAMYEYELSVTGRQAEEVREYRKTLFKKDYYQSLLDSYTDDLRALRDQLNEMFAENRRPELLLKPSELPDL